MADRTDLDRLALGASLLRQGTQELQRLRRIRGAHTRTARRIQRALAMVALAASLLGIPFGTAPASASTPDFARSTNPLGPLGTREVGPYSTPAFGDLDGDGDLDALVGSVGGLHFLTNTGTARGPIFVSDVVDPFGIVSPGAFSAPTLVDIDGDGDLDVFVGALSGRTTFFQNTGTATAPAFAAPVDDAFGLTDIGDSSASAFGDLDGDGDLDALVGNFAGATVLFENTGTATAPAFAAPVANPFGIATPGLRVRPALVDADHDGDLDVFLGTDSGQTFFARNSGTAIAPEFDAPVADTLGIQDVGYASAPAFADIDGDGELDAFVGSDLGTIAPFANASVFAAPVTNPFGLGDVGGYSAPVFGDLDGDGDFDAIVGTYSTLLVFTNTGTPFVAAFAPSVAGAFGLTDVGTELTPALADLDDDGDLDVFVGEAEGSTFFFENTGTPAAPAFAAPVTNPFGFVDLGAFSSLAFGDLDGDGDLDVLAGEDDGDAIFVENTGTPSSPAFAAPVSPAFGIDDVGDTSIHTLVDLDGDGDLDVFVGNGNGDTFFFQNVGTPTDAAFAAGRRNPFRLANVGDYSAPTFADLDGDGDLDAFLGAQDGTTRMFANPGGAGRVGFAAPPNVKYATPALADVDGDGDLDAFVGGADGRTRFLANVGTPTVASFATPIVDPFGFTDVGGFSVPTFVDIDGDGDLDAFAGEVDGDTFFSANTGTTTAPVFGQPFANPFELPPFPHSVKPAFADVDGDGDFDAFIGLGSGAIAFIPNLGTRTAAAFGTPFEGAFGLAGLAPNSVAAPTFADLDRDGDFDAFVGTNDGTVSFFQNTGTASAPAFAAPIVSAFGLADVGYYASPAFGDLDGDGDLEALVGSYDGIAFFPNFAAVPADFVGYQAKESDKKAANGALAKGCRVELDEPLLGFADGRTSAEDYDVTGVGALLLPGDTNDAGFVATDGTGMLAHRIKCAAKGVLAVVNGKFQKCRKHVKRLGVELALLRPTFGTGPATLTVDTQKETRLLVPASTALAGPVPPSPLSAPPDHYKCYQVKPAKIGPVGTLQSAPGKLVKNLQLTVEDAFGEGRGHPLFGDARRYGLVKAAELCLPTTKNNVDPLEQDAKGQTRTSTCSVPGAGISDPNVGLLCFQTSPATRTIAQPPSPGDKGTAIVPKQTKHVKRTLKSGTPVFVGHQLGAPERVDTAKEREVCVPVRVANPGTPS